MVRLKGFKVKDSWPRFWYSPGTVSGYYCQQNILLGFCTSCTTHPFNQNVPLKHYSLLKRFRPKASGGEGEAGACVMMYSSMGSAVGENVFILGVYLLWLHETQLYASREPQLAGAGCA